MKKFKRYLWLSQVNLFGWLLLSSFIVSSVIFKNGGVSNYGNHYSSVVPYTLAFVLNIVYLYLASESLLLLSRRFKYLARYMSMLCLLTAVVYASTFPRRFGVIFSDIHDDLSIALFGYELLLAVWIVIKRSTLDTATYLLIMVGGSLVALLSAIHVVHLMFIGQMVGTLGFAMLLVLSFPKVIASELEKPNKD